MVRVLGGLCIVGSFSVGRACSLGRPGNCAESPVVPTEAGPIQGFDRKIDGQLVSSFLTIPFAEPPVGALRFHYPTKSTRTWTTPYRNLTKAPACMQYKGTEDEYLNVHAPRKAIGVNDSSLLPVMFLAPYLRIALRPCRTALRSVWLWRRAVPVQSTDGTSASSTQVVPSDLHCTVLHLPLSKRPFAF